MVADRNPAWQDATSPHVSLRQAVRPVIVAYGILSSKRQAAGELAEEAETLLDATEELLRKLGLVHLLTAGGRSADPDGVQTDQTQRLVEAYAYAGMSWAKVMSSVTKLAELLMDEGDWAAARFLADMVEESGEAKVAKHIGGLLDKARRAQFDAQLAAIRTHGAMSASEIRDAVTGFRALDRRFKERSAAIIGTRTYMISSALTIAQQKKNESAIEVANMLNNRTATLQAYPHWENNERYGLPEDTLFNGILTILELCGG